MMGARAFHEPEERADLFGRNAVLDLLEAQVRQALDADPDLSNPLRARLARLLPLEPMPARGVCGAVAPAPSREAAPKPPATTEPDAKPDAGVSDSAVLRRPDTREISAPARRDTVAAGAPSESARDLDRLVSLANLDGFLRQYVRSLKGGPYRDAVNVHAEFVNRELAIVKSRLGNGNGGNRGAA
jgi:hypothetical protein